MLSKKDKIKLSAYNLYSDLLEPHLCKSEEDYYEARKILKELIDEVKQKKEKKEAFHQKQVDYINSLLK